VPPEEPIIVTAAAPHSIPATSKKNIIRAIPFEPCAELLLPAREFVFGKHYQLGKLPVLWGRMVPGSRLSVSPS
jgi:hypothetical protein